MTLQSSPSVKNTLSATKLAHRDVSIAPLHARVHLGMYDCDPHAPRQDHHQTRKTHSARRAHMCHKFSLRCWQARKYVVLHACNAGCIVQLLARLGCSFSFCRVPTLLLAGLLLSELHELEVVKGFLKQGCTGGVSKLEISPARLAVNCADETKTGWSVSLSLVVFM